MRLGLGVLLLLAACKNDAASSTSKPTFAPVYPTVEQASREIAVVSCAQAMACNNDGFDGDLETCVHQRIDPLPDKDAVFQCTQDQVEQCVIDLGALDCPDGSLLPNPASCQTIATCPTFK